MIYINIDCSVSLICRIQCSLANYIQVNASDVQLNYFNDSEQKNYTIEQLKKNYPNKKQALEEINTAPITPQIKKKAIKALLNDQDYQSIIQNKTGSKIISGAIGAVTGAAGIGLVGITISRNSSKTDNSVNDPIDNNRPLNSTQKINKKPKNQTVTSEVNVKTFYAFKGKHPEQIKKISWYKLKPQKIQKAQQNKKVNNIHLKAIENNNVLPYNNSKEKVVKKNHSSIFNNFNNHDINSSNKMSTNTDQSQPRHSKNNINQ